MEQMIEITDACASKIQELIEEEGTPNLNLRMFINGGGCAGFQYGFTFDDTINEDDMVIEKNGIKFVVDMLSIQYVAGSEIDFTESINGDQFTVYNPNANHTCGCGSSFQV
jgi:iron-sulfur cluster insertion protein